MDSLGAAVPPRPQTTAELLELWRGALRAGERKMLDELVDVSPGTLSRAELGERAGDTASGGTFGAYLGTLRRNGLIEVDGDVVRRGGVVFELTLFCVSAACIGQSTKSSLAPVCLINRLLISNFYVGAVHILRRTTP
jgi:hypothetical protein